MGESGRKDRTINTTNTQSCAAWHKFGVSAIYPGKKKKGKGRENILETDLMYL